MSRMSERLRRLDDKFVPQRTPYEPPSPREAKFFKLMAFAGLGAAVTVLIVLPDHNKVRFVVVLLAAMLIQPFVADRWERRFDRWDSGQARRRR